MLNIATLGTSSSWSTDNQMVFPRARSLLAAHSVTVSVNTTCAFATPSLVPVIVIS